MRQHFIEFVLLSIVILSCIIFGCIKNDNPSPNNPVAVPTTLQQSQSTSMITQASTPLVPSPLPTEISVQKVCKPPRLMEVIKNYYTNLPPPSICIGMEAPIFAAPKYPSGKNIIDPVIGKFSWWADMGYCEFRNDGIWILYSWDDKPHYYTGTWVRLDKDNIIHGHEYSYRIEIVRPRGMGNSNYTETIKLYYKPENDRLYLYELDEVEYHTIDAWIARLSG